MTTNKFTNRAKFDRMMKQLSEKAITELDEALSRSAELVTNTQRQYAPVDDGKLQASIHHEPVSKSEGKIAVDIKAGGPTTTRPVRKGQSSEYDYALGVEFGTKDTPAQPFFFPGYRTNRKRVKSRIRRAVKKAVKDSANQ